MKTASLVFHTRVKYLNRELSMKTASLVFQRGVKYLNRE